MSINAYVKNEDGLDVFECQFFRSWVGNTNRFLGRDLFIERTGTFEAEFSRKEAKHLIQFLKDSELKDSRFQHLSVELYHLAYHIEKNHDCILRIVG